MHDLVTAETLYDAAGNKLQGTQNTFELKQQTDATVYFPALVSVKQAIYDNNGSGSMSTTMHNGTKPSVYDMTYDAYLPYGELLVDEHTSSEDMPYKFNGKELDQETGLYYYGARYMNPVTILWYGVDALAETYPSIGGYVYCVGNLIKFVDLDGKDIFPVLFQTINNRGRIIGSQYRSNKKYMMAMRMFGQTSYGRQFNSEQKKYEKVFGN